MYKPENAVSSNETNLVNKTMHELELRNERLANIVVFNAKESAKIQKN